MQIVLIRKNEISKTALPQKISGQHQILFVDNGEPKQLCAVSADSGAWTIKENKKIELLDKYETDALGVKEIKIKEKEYYRIRSKISGEQMIILVEPTGGSRSEFSFYNVPDDGKINIGYDRANHICYHDDLLSETVSAQIEYLKTGEIIVRDARSTNGTYLNGKRITEAQANYGDEIYLVGLRIILGNRFVMVNNPDNSVSVSLTGRNSERYSIADNENETEEDSSETFSSAPRQKTGIKTEKISIEAPPQPSEEQNLPWAVVMGPSITMAFGSVFSSVFTIQNIMRSGGDISSALPTLVMAVCMVLGTIIWPFFSKRFEKRAKKAKDAKKKRKYAEHLEKVKSKIDATIAKQTKLLRENNPTVEDCVSRINGREMTLWERGPSHDDFLDVMIGLGDVPAQIELDYSHRSDVEEMSESAIAMEELVNSQRILKSVPVTIPFAKTKIVGITGERKDVLSITKALLIELTALHNYDDLKLMFIYNEKERHLWEFVKWIPHVWNKEKSIRFIANDVDEAKELSNIISNIQAISEDKKDDQHGSTRYIIIAADRILAEKIQGIKDFIKEPEKYHNISMLTLYNERKYLPKSCSVVCSVEEAGVTVSDYNNITDKPQKIDTPICFVGNPESIFVNMANIELDSLSKESALPTELTYLEMFEAGKPEHLDVLSHWEENDPVKSLAAPIGVDADGYTIKLDIHEKAHGPHGLIAGMTGSGKSEFIISYIASMATNYSPEEVAFVLIDFKGGGMADVFKNLPHLAGSITNLDGNELQRSFIAIESELEKRQALFKEISEKKKISNIDIYKYQKLRKEDRSLKALPHLIIISDEFAELKQQHSDFMEQLIRIARIGRSLGVHLILATQKPDGVVDDQIKSNIKFKVCLKVQDRADSQSVIGRPDATMITNAGRFYMQVGYNELFEYGQSPWSGAPYFPADQYKKTSGKRIDILNEQGRTIYHVKPSLPPRPENVPEKQIDALVDYLKILADNKGCEATKLWLEPMKGPKEERKRDNKDDSQAEAFVLNPIVGIYDDLRNQKHRTMTVPLTNGGNVIVYGASGSGKLSFLNQLMVSLIERHTYEELSIYALDFDSGSLSAFEKAPQVKTVALSEEIAAIENVFEEINSELEARKSMFRRFGGDYQNYVKTSGKTVPNIVLVISNFLAFAETLGDAEEKISKIAREGKKYGIFIVVTALSSNSIRYSLVPLFSNIYVLQQNNDDQYTNILGKTGGLTPGKFKGRGIFKIDNVTYEFQIRIAFEDSENIYDAIDMFCQNEADKSGYKKPEVKRLPETVTKKYFAENGLEFSAESLPVVVDSETIEPVCLDFSSSKLTLITYNKENEESAKFICKEIISVTEDIVIIDPKEQLGISDSRTITGSPEIEKFICKLEETVRSRAAEAVFAKNAGKPIPNFQHIYVLVNNYPDLENIISQHMLIRLSGLICSINEPYHINFIVLDDAENGSKLTYHFSTTLPVKQGIAFSNSSAAALCFEKNFSNSCEKGYAFVVLDNEVRKGKFIQEDGEDK